MHSGHIPKWWQLRLWSVTGCGMAKNFCLFEKMSPEKDVETFVMATVINKNETVFTYS
jgi:hypothetical protein